MTPKSYLALALCLAAWVGSSYSEDYTYGYSNNAALGGSTWGMSSSLFGLSSMDGVDVNGVIYRYTAVKDPADPFTVTVQNENSNGNGYIFRETDDWTGKPGSTINKFKTFDNSPISNWGDGSITTTGVGSVENPVVLYSYRQTAQAIEEVVVPEPLIVEEIAEADTPKETKEPDATPERVVNIPLSDNSYTQTDDYAGQPDYSEYLPEIPVYQVYNVLNDNLIEIATQQTDPQLYNSQDNESSEEDENSSVREALFAAENAITSAVGAEQSMMMRTMAKATDISSYYSVNIDGGNYQDSVTLIDGVLPDNRRAFSSMSKDSVHIEMVDQQYRR